MYSLIKWLFNLLNYQLPLSLNLVFFLDIRCIDLQIPSNGEITPCSIGVGYEGDTCNFTCNTGYELTGSGTRTCQNDRSWSGSVAVCSRGN